MKIGIITIHKGEVNYGASLQCYALWKYLENKGHDCEIIDLLRPSHKGYKYNWNIRGIRAFLSLGIKLNFNKYKSFLKDKNFINRIQRYRNFNNEIKYTKTYKSSKEIYSCPPLFDIYISGSDQIWNPLMPFENEPYLLSFAPKEKKKIAYASSFGIKDIPESVKKQYSSLLSKYDHLSTRENSGKELIKKLLGKDIPVVLDPVFLLTRDEWIEISDKRYTIKEDYILIYSLHVNEFLLSYSIELAKINNYKIILVNADYSVYKSQNIIQLRDVGPKQWLSLIQNAKLFLTDSFHGTAFSIILGTPFLTYINEKAKTNDRIYSILSCLDLTNHIISESSTNYDQNIILSQVINKKENTTTLLNQQIAFSKQYLDSAINEL